MIFNLVLTLIDLILIKIDLKVDLILNPREENLKVEILDLLKEEIPENLEVESLAKKQTKSFKLNNKAFKSKIYLIKKYLFKTHKKTKVKVKMKVNLRMNQLPQFNQKFNKIL